MRQMVADQTSVLGHFCIDILRSYERLHLIIRLKILAPINYVRATLAYCGLLISTLTTTVKGKRIETFQELADSDYYIYATPGLTPTNLILSSESQGVQAVAEKWKKQTKRDFDSTVATGNELENVLNNPKVKTDNQFSIKINFFFFFRLPELNPPQPFTIISRRKSRRLLAKRTHMSVKRSIFLRHIKLLP